MKPFGLIVIVAAIAGPLWWFAPLAAKHDPGAMFSQYLGSTALIAMAISQLMATRVAGLESIFGGLDRIYVLHKWLGIWAIATILLHDTIDADLNGLGPETLLNDLAETLGEISLYGLLILVVISIATFVPYSLWRWTHKFMGLFFALSAFHYLFILKPFENLDPLGLYVGGFCVLGLICYLYTLIPFRLLQGRYRYNVTDIERVGDTVAVTAAPEGRGLHHRAGQFAFASINEPSMGEIHPFTISSANGADNSIRFSIKALGDHTRSFSNGLTEGTQILVSAPYGHFACGRSGGDEIWIAGGIGITPFAASAAALRSGKINPKGKIDLFYSVRNKEDAIHLEELMETARMVANFTVHLNVSSADGRLTAKKLADQAGAALSDVHAYYCGPEAMRNSLAAGLAAQGMKPSRFHYEEFEIRSGIGLRRFAGWLWGLFGRRFMASNSA
ncbi:MAG: ferric reductase-like transmembrane domain-containing protein [Pseudomonadota bacterium]